MILDYVGMSISEVKWLLASPHASTHLVFKKLLTLSGVLLVVDAAQGIQAQTVILSTF